MAPVRDSALVLRRHPFGESSLVVQVLTREHGRVHLLARGAYRPTARYFALLDLFDLFELEWSSPRAGGLASLRAGLLARRRRGIAPDPERFRAASAMLELADLAARPDHADPGLFRVLDEGLEALETGALSPALALVVFELRFLQNAGLEPALERCAACGGAAPAVARSGAPGPWRERAAFSAGAGGRLCRRCAEEARASGRRVGTLPVAVLERAAVLLEHGAEARASPPSSADEVARVRDFVARFLDYHLETRPKSHRRLLAVPDRNAP
jgi:DNA repair protein RecO (recombination protein O)